MTTQQRQPLAVAVSVATVFIGLASAAVAQTTPPAKSLYDRYTEPMLNIGVTPLIRAAKAGDIPVIKLLLAHGALPNLPNFNGDTPLMAACAKGWINSPTRGANFTEDQALEEYDLLRAAGADVTLWDFYGRTPLYAAVDMNTLPKGRRVELPSVDATTGLEVITMLLDRGANPNAQLKLRLPWRQVIVLA